MKKMKKGFTLAEVLVTLGIIGVVAALTTPALIQNVGNARVAPRLQKAKATFETASEMMLNRTESNTLLGTLNQGQRDGEHLGKNLAGFMKIAFIPKNNNPNNIKNTVSKAQPTGEEEYDRFESDDGMHYLISHNLQRRAGYEVDTDNYANIPNNQLIGNVVVDINGFEEPNGEGRDIFPFFLYNDGTMRPYGGRNANRSKKDNINTWEGGSCDANWTNDAATCTGSIFDNGMRIIYDIGAVNANNDGGNQGGSGSGNGGLSQGGGSGHNGAGFDTQSETGQIDLGGAGKTGL